MNRPSTEGEHLEWEVLVGRALLRFGDIELVSVKALALLPKDEIALATSRMPFAARADVLVEILEARNERSPDEDVILQCFKRARLLTTQRNLIAHNPLMLSLFVNKEDTESVASYSISSARSGTQSMDLADLKEFAAQVDDLASDLWMAFSRVAGSSEHIYTLRDAREDTHEP